MIVIECVDNRRRFHEFARTPRLLYRTLAGFEPPLDLGEVELLKPGKASFFSHGEAAYFLARRSGQLVGRISAQIDHADPASKDGLGLFGCCDAIDDGDVVQALVEAAENWLSSKGMRHMRGPFILSINGETGLQIEGQDQDAMVLMPWHPRYLAGHLGAAGLEPVKDVLAYTLACDREFTWEKDGRLRRATGPYLKVRGLDMKHLEAEADLMLNLFNDAWAKNWGFTPMLRDEVRTMMKEFRPFLREDFGVFIERNGEAVAFALCLPNIDHLARGLGGRLLPFGWLRFGWRLWREPTRSLRLLLLGIRSDLQGSTLSAVVASILISEFIDRLRRLHWNTETVEFSWILEDNYRMRAIIESSGAKLTKRYRVFEKPLLPRREAG
jgi:hypothetical protein